MAVVPLHAHGATIKAPVTLKFALYNWAGGPPHMDKMIRQFEKEHPSIKVDMAWMGGTTYRQKIETEAVISLQHESVTTALSQGQQQAQSLLDQAWSQLGSP